MDSDVLLAPPEAPLAPPNWPEPPPLPPPLAPRTPRSPWLWLAVTAATVVLLTAGGAGIAVLAHHNSVQPASAPGPIAPVNVGGGASASSLSAWFSTVSTDYMAVANDWEGIAGLSGSDLSGVVTACSQLGADTATLQLDAPIPDPTMNAVYQDALTNTTKFANGCVYGAADASASELEAAAQYETKALSDFEQLDRLLGAVGVAAVPVVS
jgi:hypothetical protein